VQTLRLTLAVLAAAIAVAAVSVVAVAAPSSVGIAASPHAGAAAAQYCTPAEKKRRQAVLKRYTQQMVAARKAYFRTTRSPKARASFVKKQQAQRATLIRSLRRCN
jgi:hypothetical protein